MLRKTISQVAPMLALCDLLFGVALVAVWVLVPAEPALAYVDPSVMTYTIQALAAVAVALVGGAWAVGPFEAPPDEGAHGGSCT